MFQARISRDTRKPARSKPAQKPAPERGQSDYKLLRRKTTQPPASTLTHTNSLASPKKAAGPQHPPRDTREHQNPNHLHISLQTNNPHSPKHLSHMVKRTILLEEIADYEAGTID